MYAIVLSCVGKPAVDTRLLLRGKRFSSICAVGLDGILGIYTTKGSINADVFSDFLDRDVVPKLMPFNGNNPKSIVLMDNASIHHCSEVIATIENAGALLHFLPPYSPDLNPAEEVFSKEKYYLQQNDPVIETSSEEEFNDIILQGFCTITADDCYGYFNHAGYV